MTSFFECNFVVLLPSKFVYEKYPKQTKIEGKIREISLSAGIISMGKMRRRRRRWWRGKDARIATWCPRGIFSSFVVFYFQKPLETTFVRELAKILRPGRAFHHQAFPLPNVFPSRKGIWLSSITFHIKIRGEEKTNFHDTWLFLLITTRVFTMDYTNIYILA